MTSATDSKRLDTAGYILFNAGCVYRRLRRSSRRLGIRWQAITLLKDIELLEPVTQKDLATLNQISAPSVSVAVKGLVAEGLVQRVPDPSDGRSAGLSLTRRGRAKLDAEALALQNSLAEVLEDLSADQLDLLHRAEALLAGTFRD